MEYFNKWTWKRGIQLLVGLFFLNDYFADGGRLALVFGGMMFAQAVLNVGCFSSKGCSTNLPKTKEPFSEEAPIEYEEVE